MSNEEDKTIPVGSTPADLPVDGSTVPAAGTSDHVDEKELHGGGKTYAETAKANGLRYAVSDVPPLGLSTLLGIQHYLTMLGATFLIPTIICPAMGANVAQTGQVISTIFFVSGLAVSNRASLASTSS